MNALSKPILEGVLEYDPIRDYDTLNTLNGVVNLLFGAGALIGVSVTGKLSTLIGRLPILYIGEALALLNAVPSAIKGLAPLLICRVLHGFVAGMNVSIYSIILAELLPNKLCGIGGTLGNLFMAIGSMMSFLCQNFWTYEELVEYWRVFLLYPLVVSLLRILLFSLLFRTDTPKFYFERENKRVPPKRNKINPNKLPSVLQRPSVLAILDQPVQRPGVTTTPSGHAIITVEVGYNHNSKDGPLETEQDLAPAESEKEDPQIDNGNKLEPTDTADKRPEPIDIDNNTETLETDPDQAPMPSERKKLSLFSPISPKRNNRRSISESKRTKSVVVSLFLMRRAYALIYHPDDVDEVVQEQASFMVKEKYDGRATVTFRHLFSTQYRRQLASGCFVMMASQLSGINFFLFYSTGIFDSIANNGKLMTLIVGISNIGGALLATPMIYKLGRKMNMLIGTSLQSLGMMMLAIGVDTLNVPLLIISTIIYMAGYSIGLGGTITTYTSEILPPNGVALAFSFLTCLDMLTGMLLPLLAVWVGPMALIVFFSIFNFVAVLTMWLTCVETKDKDFQEICDEFNQSWIHVCKPKSK